MKKLTLAIALVLSACAETQPAVTQQPATVERTALTDEQARQLVASFEAKQADGDASEPLRNPKSFEDALEILKRDQVDLFAPGAKWADAQPDPKAKALQAQIELSWGEAQSLISQVLNNNLGSLRREQARLESKGASGDLSEAEHKRLDALRQRVAEKGQLADALQRTSNEHIARGAALAKGVIQANPSDYHGYRVAADYYRLRQDWQGFDQMVAKLEQVNPGSNGLLFAKGMEAQERSGDSATANKLLAEALEKDPKFTRAQAELVLIQKGPSETYAEYQKLKALNPHHQVVVWAGDVIEDAHDQLMEEARLQREFRNDAAVDRAVRATPGAH
jgi:hypothetical protein